MITVTENERIRTINKHHSDFHDADYSEQCDMCFLLQQLDQRDKTIVEMQQSELEFLNIARERAEKLKRAYTLMLSALEWYAKRPMSTSSTAIEALAQVKALTVSKQEESTATKPPCEQPTHDLSKEVHTDILWRSREGEPV